MSTSADTEQPDALHIAQTAIAEMTLAMATLHTDLQAVTQERDRWREAHRQQTSDVEELLLAEELIRNAAAELSQQNMQLQERLDELEYVRIAPHRHHYQRSRRRRPACGKMRSTPLREPRYLNTIRMVTARELAN